MKDRTYTYNVASVTTVDYGPNKMFMANLTAITTDGSSYTERPSAINISITEGDLVPGDQITLSFQKVTIAS